MKFIVELILYFIFGIIYLIVSLKLYFSHSDLCKSIYAAVNNVIRNVDVSSALIILAIGIPYYCFARFIVKRIMKIVFNYDIG